MPNGYTRSPKLLKGAFVKLSEEFLGPVPDIIVFQYNPETIKRDLTPSSAESEFGGRWGEETTAEPFDPGEKFDLTLEIDATDALEEPDKHPVAVVSGIADRISALEMLLYPVGDSLLGDLMPALFGSGDAVPRGSVPIVLFIWGPGRILPVRLTSFSVKEQAFSPSLYPIRASVTVGLQVLPDQVFKKLGRKLSASEEMAVAAYKFTRGQREVLARTNLANSAESILSMLPF
ncbi:MAG: hypothetical protein LWW98_03195 [Deltaproteobacteria bacterium]|nr:hypothetical protein [Deltaproteobacteria bacterium]